MKLLRPIPSNRTLSSVKNHYRVEKEIAERIKKADKVNRKKIYATMYDELFDKVPDHPRLTRRGSDELSRESFKIKKMLLRGNIRKDMIFAEFAPGDCRFSQAIASEYKCVYAIDISDQRSTEFEEPNNFNLIIYDGYNLDQIDDESVDVLFSDQLIEHFHPDETKDHFLMSYRIVKKKGSYIFSTPHLFAGPQDVSMYFSYVPEGFHLKEWTYTELVDLLRFVGFGTIKAYWFARGVKLALPLFYFLMMEKIFRLTPLPYRRRLSRYFLPSICIKAVKD